MKTVSVRELRAKTARIWRELGREKELVVTANGHPVGILSAASEEGLSDTLAALRRARAVLAVARMQARSAQEGRHRFSPAEIEAEIAAVRRRRRR